MKFGKGNDNDFSKKFNNAGQQGGKPQPPQGQQQRVQIDPDKLMDIECDECGCEFFRPVHKIKKLSAVVSPTGEEAIFPVQLFVCDECKAVPDIVKEQLNDFGG